MRLQSYISLIIACISLLPICSQAEDQTQESLQPLNLKPVSSYKKTVFFHKAVSGNIVSFDYGNFELWLFGVMAPTKSLEPERHQRAIDYIEDTLGNAKRVAIEFDLDHIENRIGKRAGWVWFYDNNDNPHLLQEALLIEGLVDYLAVVESDFYPELATLYQDDGVDHTPGFDTDKELYEKYGGFPLDALQMGVFPEGVDGIKWMDLHWSRNAVSDDEHHLYDFALELDCLKVVRIFDAEVLFFDSAGSYVGKGVIYINSSLGDETLLGEHFLTGIASLSDKPVSIRLELKQVQFQT